MKKMLRYSPSKVHENMLRIKTLHVLVDFGYASAKQALLLCSRHLGHLLHLAENEIENNRYGVAKELDFYASFAKKYSLIPTLDAGCQFDFVGMFQRSIIAIDVCGGISNKANMAISFGALQWQRYAVWVKCVNVDWYWTRSGILGLAGMPADRISIRSNLKLSCTIVERGTNVEHFEFVRHSWLSRVANNERVSTLIEELNSSIGIERGDKNLLIAQIRFFKTYRYALNLVTTVSFVDGIDFVGQHGINLVRYHIIVDCDSCRNNEYKVLSGLRYSNEDYKIVLFDDDENQFLFKSIDDPVFFA